LLIARTFGVSRADLPMPRNPYEAAVRLRLPNGRPATAKTASTSAIQGRHGAVARATLAEVFLNATYPEARSAKRGVLANDKANPASSLVPAGRDSDGLIDTSDRCANMQ